MRWDVPELWPEQGWIINCIAKSVTQSCSSIPGGLTKLSGLHVHKDGRGWVLSPSLWAQDEKESWWGADETHLEFIYSSAQTLSPHQPFNSCKTKLKSEKVTNLRSQRLHLSLSTYFDSFLLKKIQIKITNPRLHRLRLLPLHRLRARLNETFRGRSQARVNQ